MPGVAAITTRADLAESCLAFDLGRLQEREMACLDVENDPIGRSTSTPAVPASMSAFMSVGYIREPR